MRNRKSEHRHGLPSRKKNIDQKFEKKTIESTLFETRTVLNPNRKERSQTNKCKSQIDPPKERADPELFLIGVN